LRNGVLALIVIGLALLFLVPVAVMSFWMWSRGGWMMMPGMVGWSRAWYAFESGRMLVGTLLFFVFVGLTVLGVYYLVTGRGIVEPSRDRSIELLRERYAKGEISEDQFRKMKEALQS
jgi:putative membrane protein